MNLDLKDNFCILQMFVLTDTAFDFLSGSGSAFSPHVLVKMKAVHAHSGKGGHTLHLHCRWEEAAHSVLQFTFLFLDYEQGNTESMVCSYVLQAVILLLSEWDC